MHPLNPYSKSNAQTPIQTLPNTKKALLIQQYHIPNLNLALSNQLLLPNPTHISHTSPWYISYTIHSTTNSTNHNLNQPQPEQTTTPMNHTNQHNPNNHNINQLQLQFNQHNPQPMLLLKQNDTLIYQYQLQASTTSTMHNYNEIPQPHQTAPQPKNPRCNSNQPILNQPQS